MIRNYTDNGIDIGNYTFKYFNNPSTLYHSDDFIVTSLCTTFGFTESPKRLLI